MTLQGIKRRVSSLAIVGLIGSVVLAFLGFAAAQDPQQGGTLVVSPPQRITELDPYKGAGHGNRLFRENVFEPLVTLAPDGSLEGRIAESWDISADGLTITFHIRPGMTFHNGAAITSADVKYSLDRARNPELGINSASTLVSIAGVEIVDDSTVDVTLSRADRLLLPQLYNAGLIMPNDDSIDHGENPIGSGPFQFVSRGEDGTIVLERFDGYFEAGLPYLDGLELVEIAEAALKPLQLQTGQIDFLFGVSGAHIEELQADPNLTIDTGGRSTGRVLFLFHQVADPDSPLHDVRVRQAISLAIDRDKVADIAFLGAATVRCDIITGGLPADDAAPCARDVERAKSLLEEAGYPDGVDVETIWLPGDDPQHESALLIAQDSLKDAGINLMLSAPDRATFIDQLVNSTYISLNSSTFTLPGAYEEIWTIVGRMHAGYMAIDEGYPDVWDRMVEASAIADESAFTEEVSSLRSLVNELQFATLIVELPTPNGMQADVFGYTTRPIGIRYLRDVWVNR